MNSREKPLVSIITTAYTREYGVLGAIASVNRQTFTDWEHIIVGDNCPVLSKRFLSYADRNRRRIINLPDRNNDMGATPLNEGILESRGKYYCVLADDNLWIPEHLETLVSLIEANPDWGFVGCSTELRAKAGNDTSGFRDISWPVWGGVDLGDCLYKREIYDRYGPYNFHFEGKMSIREPLDRDNNPLVKYSYDWRFLEKCLRGGVKWGHSRKVTFIFYMGAEPKYDADKVHARGAPEPTVDDSYAPGGGCNQPARAG